MRLLPVMKVRSMVPFAPAGIARTMVGLPCALARRLALGDGPGHRIRLRDRTSRTGHLIGDINQVRP